MSDIAIKIENLSKQYRLGLVGTGTLAHDLKRWWTVNVRGKEDPYLKIGEANKQDAKGESEYVWALRDINLEVKQGEVLGIIGKNGAGKSTLLKILSRVTKPTTGSITYKGRIASLLEVGTGFHPEMTGRENIYMNGAIMGMTKAEITRKLDEIIAFAGVERYIDTPVKRYSSGMKVRLGFAVAAHLEPEILVVDEVLAVGDAEFQKKAIGKMQDVSKGGGRTVLFVSHNMTAIKLLCPKSLLLSDGFLLNSGDSELIVAEYLISNKKPEAISLPIKSITGELQLENLSNYRTYNDHIIDIDLSILTKIPRLGFGVEIKSVDGVRLVNQGAIHNNLYISNPEKQHRASIKLENIYALLNPSEYLITLWISSPGIEKFLELRDIITIEIKEQNPYANSQELSIIKNGPLFIKCVFN